MVIVDIEKNVREVIRVSVLEYKSHRFIDIRFFWLDGEEWMPRKKGITISSTKLNDLLTALSKAKQQLQIEADHG